MVISLRFFKNALLLTVTGLILRGLGMLLRVFISTRIGEEGMGVYQLISSAYFLFITLSHAGIAVTVTRRAATKLSQGKSAGGVVASGIRLSLITGILSALIMLVSAPIVSRYWLADTRATYSLITLALSLPFVSCCGVLSAYFTATRQVSYGCGAQLLEQITRIAASAVAFYITKSAPLGIMLAAVYFANTLSEAVACLFLAAVYSKNKTPYTKRESIREISVQSMPVAASKLLSSGLHTAENMLVPSALALYCGSRQAALADFGALKGMALPLMFFPFSFISALSTLLLPEIAEAGVRGGKARTSSLIDKTCSLTLTLSTLIAGIFFLNADTLGALIYKSERVSMIIRVLSPIIPFMYLDSICDGLLKGLGKQRQVLYNNCIDSGIRIVLVILTLKFTGINGFLAIMIFSNVLICMLNLRILTKSAGLKINYLQWFLLPFGCVLISAIVTKFLLPMCATLPKKLLSTSVFCLFFVVLRLFFNLKFKKTKIS